MSVTIDVNTAFKAESKRRKGCKLQYVGSSKDKGNGVITTLLIPSLNEDRKREDEDDAFDRQIHDCHNIRVDGVALAEDDASAAKKFRAAFNGKRTQPGLVDFLVQSGRPGVLHSPLASMINTVFLGKYIALPLEPATRQIEYQIQKDGSVIVINTFSGAYIENSKIFDYPEDENGQKPQISRVNTCIVHKIEMKNAKPQVSIIERQVSVESENAKEANIMGSLLAKKMEIDLIKPKAESTRKIAAQGAQSQSDKETTDSPKKTANNPISNFLFKVLRNVKELVLMMLPKQHIKKSAGESQGNSNTGPGLFKPTDGGWNISKAKAQAAKITAESVMPTSKAYEGAGFLGAHRVVGPVDVQRVDAIKHSIPGH